MEKTLNMKSVVILIDSGFNKNDDHYYCYYCFFLDKEFKFHGCRDVLMMSVDINSIAF